VKLQSLIYISLDVNKNRSCMVGKVRPQKKIPPEHLYPSPEPLPPLSYLVLQELRSRIIEPVVLSVPRTPPASITRPKLTLPPPSTNSCPLPPHTARAPGSSTNFPCTTGLGILAYFSSSTVQDVTVFNSPGTATPDLPTIPATRPKQKKKIHPHSSIPMDYKLRVKVSAPLTDQLSVAYLRTPKIPSFTVTSPKMSSLPDPPSASATLSPPKVPSSPKSYTLAVKIPYPRRPTPLSERLASAVGQKVSKYSSSESGLSFHVVYGSSFLYRGTSDILACWLAPPPIRLV